MASSRNHQGAHGIGQAEEQLQQQIEAGTKAQGKQHEIDRSVTQAAHVTKTELDDIPE